MTKNQIRLWVDGRTVDVNGTIYKQTSIYTFDNPAPRGDPCYNCVAFSNMRLCDFICPYCQQDHVFILRERRKTK